MRHRREGGGRPGERALLHLGQGDPPSPIQEARADVWLQVPGQAAVPVIVEHRPVLNANHKQGEEVLAYVGHGHEKSGAGEVGAPQVVLEDVRDLPWHRETPVTDPYYLLLAGGQYPLDVIQVLHLPYPSGRQVTQSSEVYSLVVGVEELGRAYRGTRGKGASGEA